MKQSTTHCPKCKAKFAISPSGSSYPAYSPTAFVGRVATCPRCGTNFAVEIDGTTGQNKHWVEQIQTKTVSTYCPPPPGTALVPHRSQILVPSKIPTTTTHSGAITAMALCSIGVAIWAVSIFKQPGSIVCLILLAGWLVWVCSKNTKHKKPKPKPVDNRPINVQWDEYLATKMSPERFEKYQRVQQYKENQRRDKEVKRLVAFGAGAIGGLLWHAYREADRERQIGIIDEALKRRGF